MKPIIALVVAATLCPEVLSAADSEREREWKKDIFHCVQEVRRLHRYSEFDAFAKPGFRLESFGTEQERFQFKKCMAERGYYLDEK